MCVNMEMVKDALDQLRGAVMIVYPMGLPPHDPIRMELEDKEDLSGTHVCSNVFVLYVVTGLNMLFNMLLKHIKLFSIIISEDYLHLHDKFCFIFLSDIFM